MPNKNFEQRYDAWAAAEAELYLSQENNEGLESDGLESAETTELRAIADLLRKALWAQPGENLA